MQIRDDFADMPTLETERLVLRKLREEDEEDIFRYASDPEIFRYTIWESHRSLDDTRAFLRKIGYRT